MSPSQMTNMSISCSTTASSPEGVSPRGEECEAAEHLTPEYGSCRKHRRQCDWDPLVHSFWPGMGSSKANEVEAMLEEIRIACQAKAKARAAQDKLRKAEDPKAASEATGQA
eukprot:TRINITY_DN99979_c0_g1_i1.p2 TRINITY_DN99979_c0_g1~~TRINITY_DN99979_c0_g1_i1.p2  ORF type:complete len:112 (-),score=25.04 TRINITY_DN99979_c0_g1_i1:60-395(-)